MSEEEWLASTEPMEMYGFVREATTNWRTRWAGWITGRRFSISERKLRFACCACCAGIVRLLPDEAADVCLRISERFAEGEVTREELAATLARYEIPPEQWPVGAEHPEMAFSIWAFAFAWREVRRPGEPTMQEEWGKASKLVAERELPRQAHLLRDVLGNPFRPVRLDPAWLRWDAGAVRHIAQTIHADRAYHDVPVLGDALEEAGCRDEQVLNHCRGPGPHVPGCWVVDLVLGKS